MMASWLCAGRKYLKLTNRSDLPRRKLPVVVSLSANPSAWLLPSTPAWRWPTNLCKWMLNIVTCQSGFLFYLPTFFFLLLIWICENEFTCSLTVTSQDCPAESPAVGSCGRRIKVPSGENTELQCSPFTAWSRPYYSHACYAYCQGFLHYFYSSPTFSQNLSRFLSVLAVANIGSCVGPQNKMGPPAGCRFPC